jgi:putative chitinase
MEFEFTLEHMKSAIPTNKEVGEWYIIALELLPQYDITTPERVAGFLSQCAYESSEFKVLEENLNYSEKALLRVFGKYFGPGIRDAKAYARNPEKIANAVYASRMGNGAEHSGDGWRFRGRGVIQLTGKDNYSSFAQYVYSIRKEVMTFDEVIEYLTTKRGAMEAACWYWKVNGLNAAADRRDVKSMTKLINGGTNGLTKRQTIYKRVMASLEPVHEPHAITRILGIGSEGEDVKTLQRALNIKADGKFGPQTHRAVKLFQTANNLYRDGIVGPKTLEALGIPHAH